MAGIRRCLPISHYVTVEQRARVIVKDKHCALHGWQIACAVLGKEGKTLRAYPDAVNPGRTFDKRVLPTLHELALDHRAQTVVRFRHGVDCIAPAKCHGGI